MRLGIKRSVFAFATITVSALVLFNVVHTPTSFTRHQREGERQRHDHLESMMNVLQNCSCYINYIKNHIPDAGKLFPNASVAAVIAQTHLNVNSTRNTTANETGTRDALQEPNATKNVTLILPPTSQKGENTNATEGRPVALYLQEPIDTHLFSYIHNPATTCFHENGTEMDVYLIFFVPSSPGNFDLRQSIRKTYGNRDTWPTINGSRVVTVFLLAATDAKGIQHSIDTEANDYGDVVQESFHDSYLNLTRKTIMGLKWVTNHCRHARYAMKIDDDTTVIQPRILQVLENAPRIKYIYGCVFRKPIVDRNKKSKFYMSEEYYPDKHFPAYAIGAGYIMSTDMVEAAFNVAITIPMFPWEDVFVGMCLHKLNAELHHDAGFLYRAASYSPLLTSQGDKLAQGHATVTSVNKNDMLRLYEKFRIKR